MYTGLQETLEDVEHLSLAEQVSLHVMLLHAPAALHLCMIFLRCTAFVVCVKVSAC